MSWGQSQPSGPRSSLWTPVRPAAAALAPMSRRMASTWVWVRRGAAFFTASRAVSRTMPFRAPVSSRSRAPPASTVPSERPARERARGLAAPTWPQTRSKITGGRRKWPGPRRHRGAEGDRKGSGQSHSPRSIPPGPGCGWPDSLCPAG